MLTNIVLALATVGFGTLVGLPGLGAAEVQPAALLILSFGAVLGAAFPDGAWRRAVMLGLSMPLAHVIAQVTGTVLPYPIPRLADTFLALVPAFVGTFLGVGARRLLAPAHKEHPRG
ncbi:MAG: hypothetical protein ACJ79S_02785 [Gemmatimonadaceae bacterium]